MFQCPLYKRKKIVFISLYIISSLFISSCANSKYFAGVQLPPLQASLINIIPIKQTKTYTCGYASLASVALYYDVALTSLTEGELQEKFSNKNLSVKDIIEVGTILQLKVFAYQGNYSDLQKNIKNGRPVLILLKKPLNIYNFPSLNWTIEAYLSLFKESHWVVVCGSIPDNKIVIHDPLRGFLTVSRQVLEKEWDSGISILISRAGTSS